MEFVDVIWKIGPALATVVVGSFGLYLAYRQYRAAHDKVRLDLFDRRMKAFEKLNLFFRLLIREGGTDRRVWAAFWDAYNQAIFLFGPDIFRKFEQIKTDIRLLDAIDDRLFSNALPMGPKRNAVANESDVVYRRLVHEHAVLSKTFAPYLDFGGWVSDPGFLDAGQINRRVV